MHAEPAAVSELSSKGLATSIEVPALKKPAFPVHPLLFVIYPALALFSANVEVTNPIDLLLIAGAGIASVALLLFLFARLTRSLQLGGLFATLAVGMLFAYRSLHNVFELNWVALARETPLAEWTFRFIWLCVGLLAAKLLMRFVSALPFVTKLLNVVSLSLCLVAATTITTQLALPPKKPTLTRADAIAVNEVFKGRLPNVYYIILDCFGREDSLKYYGDLDIQPFLNKLRDRGFYVAQDSTTNYHQTQLSLASSLNMNYNTVVFKDIWGKPRGTINRRVQDSRSAHLFRDLGYRYTWIGSGCVFFDGWSSDQFIQKERFRVSPYLMTLLEHTPFAVRGSLLYETADAKRIQTRYAVGQISEASKEFDAPSFVVAHIFLPHPPFVFNSDGSDRDPGQNSFREGEVLGEYDMDVDQYREGYKLQTEYTQDLIIQELDELIAKEPNAIIIVQGDHGPKALHREDAQKTELAEEFPILNAYRVTEKMRERLYPSITPVNSFRVILSELSNTKFELLPDRNYFATWEEPYKYVDVSKPLADDVKAMRTKLQASN